MKKLIGTAVLYFTLLALGGGAMCVVVDFEGAPAFGANLTGTPYSGLTWEPGGPGSNGNLGYWLVNSAPAAHSGHIYAMNAYGATLLGIGFPGRVNVSGAWMSSQAAPIGRTTGVRVHGYRSGAEVAVTRLSDEVIEQALRVGAAHHVVNFSQL